MRRRMWVLVCVIVVVPLAVSADPGDVVTGYGEDGRVDLGVTSNVGVRDVRSDPNGRVAVAFAGDPESGTAALIAADGSGVVPIDLGGPGTVAFGPGGWLYVAVDEPGRVAVRRYGGAGTLDTGFGMDGTAALDVPSAVAGDILVDADGILVVGGVLDEPHAAWATRFDSGGEVDTDFGLNGVVTLDSAEGQAADLILATDVHATGDGYLAVVLTRSLQGDRVAVVSFDEGGTSRLTELTYDDEIVSTASVALEDGSVLVAVQTTADDTDTFDLTLFAPDGTRDTAFSDPGLTDDEVGSSAYLTRLRTGEVALAYNTGPDAAFSIHLVDPEGTEVGRLDAAVDGVWMYGMTAVSHDGSLVVAVDETPTSSVEPDDLTLVKVITDDLGRFIDDDHSVHESDIEELARRNVTRGCNPPANTRFCAEDPVTRAQMAAFLVRALGLGPVTDDAFVDDDTSVFEGDIDRLAAAGITRGCDPPANTRFCPEDPVTRAQMASLLIRALPDG